MTVGRRVLFFAVAAALVGGSLLAAPAIRRADPPFPHDKHAKLFPLCTACHAGVLDTARSIWPEALGCASCHDSIVKPRVTWQPRTGPRPGNRRFTHAAHHRAATAKNPADSAVIQNCVGCHTAVGAARMMVQNAVVEQCIECHKLAEPHVDVPSAACATCHVRLTEAPLLTRTDVESFPKPQSHSEADFVLGGHGKAARVAGVTSGPGAVAASCATCHARNYCLSCHVNALESPVIMALALDDRSPTRVLPQPVPATHRAPEFLRAHGRQAQRPGATCANCHARESCTSCHIGAPPRAVAALPAGGPGRAPGALMSRARPASHTRDYKDRHASDANARPVSCASCHARESCTSCHRGALPRVVADMAASGVGQAAGAQWARTPPASHALEFRDRHGAEANARPTTCEACHARSTCLECHRPDGGRQSRHHPQAFLTRHPSSAYAREANCSDCHNAAQFCQSCHQQAGLVATARIGRKGYHDAFRGFSLGHGQAARQSLESCASCHAERDCTACHSAVGGGFGFSPHGPGFNANRMRARNPSLCVACHGGAIPKGR